MSGTLVDSNVILDIVTDDAEWGDWSAARLAEAAEAGMLAKIGLNTRGFGVCLKVLRSVHDGAQTGVPVHVLSAALFDRFESRDEAEFASRILSAMRKQFGGHAEKPAVKP